MFRKRLGAAPPQTVDHKPRARERHVRQLGVRPIEVAVIEQHAQTTQQVLPVAWFKMKNGLGRVDGF